MKSSLSESNGRRENTRFFFSLIYINREFLSKPGRIWNAPDWLYSQVYSSLVTYTNVITTYPLVSHFLFSLSQWNEAEILRIYLKSSLGVIQRTEKLSLNKKNCEQRTFCMKINYNFSRIA